jgi:hypothetical protein
MARPVHAVTQHRFLDSYLRELKTAQLKKENKHARKRRKT